MVTDGKIDGSSNGGGGDSGSVSVPITSSNAPPPFLSKTYDMVDDSSTNLIVSWSPTNNSFVVWDPPEFARGLLPKYFKHNNFSSFVRQLNTYGFRKVDPDRWEFANEGFLRGQKHLLKSITRRKPVHSGHTPQNPQQPHGQGPLVGACVEVGKFGLEEEVERLKRDKNVLMQEVVRLRQQQQTTDNQLQAVVQRLQGMEQRQQQMMSFMAKAVQSPGFLAQFVQQQNESNRRISETNKKRRIKQEGTSDSGSSADGQQIVKYQPLMNEAAKAMLRQIMNKPDGFLIGDGSSSLLGAMDNGSSSSSRISEVTLQEALPDIDALVQVQEAPSVSTSQGDTIMSELPQMPEMIPENIVNIPEEEYVGPEPDSSEFVDPNALGDKWAMALDIDNLASDPEIDALLENSSFWNDLLVQSPTQEIESTYVAGSEGNDVQLTDHNWAKGQNNMDKLTEQMELLSSDIQGL